MSTYSGRKVSIGIAMEGTRSTAEAADFWIRHEEESFLDTAKNIFNESAIGVLNKNSGSEVVDTMGEGSFGGKITDRAFGFLLWGALGSYSVSTTAGESVVYDHSFTESQENAAKTLSITRYDPNQARIFAGAMVNSFEITAAAGDFARHSTAFVSQPSSTTSASPAFVTENEFVARHVTVKFADATDAFAVATAVNAKSVKLTMNKNSSAYFIVGQNNPDDIFAQSVEITGELVLRYEDQTYYSQRFNNTKKAMQIKLANTGITLGNSSNPTLTLTMPEVYLSEWKLDQGLDGIVEQTLSFNAVYSIASSSALSATLTNTVSSYSTATVS